MTAPLRIALLGLITLLLAGCGSAGRNEDVAKAEPTVSSADPAAEDVTVTCDGVIGWPVSAMTDRIPKSESADLVPALEKLAATGGMDAPPAFQHTAVEDADWFVLTRDDQAAAVATGPWSATGPGKAAQIVYLDHEGSAWRAHGWGDCRLAPLAPDGTQWVKVDGISGTRDSTKPTLLVNEVNCTSGRDPRPYLREPTVVETEATVTVSWTSTAVIGGANCIGNNPVPASVQLAVPLGDRDLYDGSVWPARKVR